MSMHVETRLVHEKRLRLVNAVTLLARDDAGRELLRWLLEVTGIQRTGILPQEMEKAGLLYYDAGRREIGERVLRLIYAAKLPAELVADIFKEDNDNG